jgi:hypothetical protein
LPWPKLGLRARACPAVSLTEFHGDQWACPWVRGVMGVRFLASKLAGRGAAFPAI